MNRIKIHHGHILTPYRLIRDGYILIEDGMIVEVGEGDAEYPRSQTIDAKGLYVSPGFIDMHTHGAGGHDFMDGTVDAFLGAATTSARYGATCILPTMLTSKMEELNNFLDVYEKASVLNVSGAHMAGLHLEGPYFSMQQKGAQDPRYIRNPDPDEYEGILDRSKHIVRWSAAPELTGALAFGTTLKRRGILPSIAHSDAIYEEVVTAFEHGYTHVTHLYSGMSGVKRINAYRFAGVIESAFLIDDMTVEIIADGAHLPSSLLKLIYKIKGTSGIALVTDSMRGAGMPEGESILGSLADGQKVLIEDGVAKLLDRTAFAGSVATPDRLVRTMINLADVPLLEAVKMITTIPAGILKMQSKGVLTPGKDADITFFDPDIRIAGTMVKGRVIYSAGDICLS